MRSLLPLCSLSILLTGCLLDRSPLVGQSSPPLDGGSLDASILDGGARVDGGLRDAGLRDAGRDAGTDGATDGATDAGPSCAAADTRCDGDRAVVCTALGLRSEDCNAVGARCVVGAEGPRCEAWLCRPSSTRCSDDGDQIVTCDAAGTSESAAPCTRGCVAGMCTPRGDCTREVAASLAGAGTVGFSLCGGGNDDDYVAAEDQCRDSLSANGEDRLVRLELDRRRVVRIDVIDSDSARLVDPVVYLRRRCGDPASQIACADDVMGSLDARLSPELDPGEYFIVVDSFNYTREGRTYGCGSVTVTVTLF